VVVDLVYREREREERERREREESLFLVTD